MKKVTAIALVFALMFVLCSCSNNDITFSEDGSELYYNGYTYVELDNTSGRYRVDTENEECMEIFRRPYGFWYILGAVTVYFGNDQEKPDYLYANRGHGFYLREDLTIDLDTKLTMQYKNPYSFAISDAITEEKVAFSAHNEDAYAELLEFKVTVEPYDAVSKTITISKKDGIMYIQDCWNSDYYVITQEFFDELSQAYMDRNVN